MGTNNDNSGALFKNTHMREGKQDSEYQGNCMINGIEFWINAWVNTSKKDGSKYFGLKFRRKNQAPEPAEQKTAPVDPDQFLPF